MGVDMRKARATRTARVGRADQQVAGFLLLTIVGVMAFMAIVGRGTKPTIAEEAERLSVSARGYHQQIPYASIDSVALRHGLNGLHGRRNGLQSGNTYVGRFEMEPYGEAMLFVDALREPLVVIYAKEGVTLISAEDSVGAERLAARTRQTAASVRRAEFRRRD
ncbi:MAG: hypothetical protein HEQ38_07255 [Gemmatimonas sp.]|jgi:hypothetical protein|uniref:PH domain-containing protein n=2 Tax=Gemmatimonas sp. TaxID=1962908 RepID=UPI0031C57760|nr:hypothetical protein [Gemmatimonas sp.]